MIVYEELIQASASRKKNIEIELIGQAVSRGVAIGKVVCLHGRKRQFYRIKLNNTQIEDELRRLHTALEVAKNQIKKIALQESKIVRASKTNIFDLSIV